MNTEKSACLLSVENVRKRYGRTVALDGIDLSISAGELFGLLGPNGAGKTTLLSILAGLLIPDSGVIRIGDHAAGPESLDVRRSIGLAPQDLSLYSDLSARENLRFFGQLYGLLGPRLEKRVDESLTAVQLSDRADDRAGTFSGGMKRRLNLAISVVHRPQLLLLDEPTTGVDPQSRNAIFEEVRRLNAEGTTVIYTSHYMEEVQALCPRVGIIDHGKMVRIGPIRELLATEESVIRFQFTDSARAGLTGERRAGGVSPPSEMAHWQSLPGVSSVNSNNGQVELRTADPTRVLPELMKLLHQLGRSAEGLEIQRPTLERVFLSLTGHALRD